jgi:multiple sugar transport system substrate-binding protein
MMINLTDWEEFAKSYDVSTDDLMTWEGVAETAEKYYNYTDALTPDIENDGKAFFGRDSVANYMNIGSKQLGAEFVSKDENNNVVINVDETVVRRLWDNYYVPYVKGYYTAQGRYRSDDAKVGKIIALVCSTTGATYYPSEITLDDDYTYPIENVVLPVPNFEGTDPYIVQQGAGMSVVKSDEKTEYACSVFLKWFTEEERNIEFSVNSGYLPVKKSANDFSKISEVVENENLDINETIQNTLRIAIDEINSYTLYTTISFDKSTELRNYLGNFIQDTADEDYAEICERIESGEKREDVLEEYTNDTAFSNWFAQFKTGLEQTASES